VAPRDYTASAWTAAWKAGGSLGADWVARGTAFGGAAVALASLGWNITAWYRQGPVVKLRVTCSGRGAQMKISGRVTNTGRFDARIESASLHWTSSPQSGNALVPPTSLWCELLADHIEGLTLGQPLPAQSGEEFVINDINGIDLGLAVALHDRRHVTLAFRTASGRKAKKTIKYS
jgi:hypothetical protein